MKTITRTIPIGQLSIYRRELEQSGATDIDWSPAGNGYVEVTATIPGDSVLQKVERVTRWFRKPL